MTKTKRATSFLIMIAPYSSCSCLHFSCLHFSRPHFSCPHSSAAAAKTVTSFRPSHHSMVEEDEAPTASGSYMRCVCSKGLKRRRYCAYIRTDRWTGNIGDTAQPSISLLSPNPDGMSINSDGLENLADNFNLTTV